MAQTITIKVSLDTGDVRAGASQIERQVKTAVDGAERSAQSGGRRVGQALTAGLVGAFSVTAITAGLTAVIGASLQAAKEIDKARQTIAALTGSVGAANAKLAELRKLAQDSPGVTTTFASKLFAQFKALGEVTDTTITRIIQSIGKLNAAFTLPDPEQFARNLQQIFNQGFERADIKEAIGQVPIFEQLLEQAFGTKDPDKLRQLKQAGELTLDTFLLGFAGAVSNDARFANIQESLETRINKLRESILTSLAPLGDEIGNIIAGGLTEIANQLRESSDALRDFAREVSALVGDIAAAFNKLNSGNVLFNLRDELRDLQGLVAIVRDIVTLGEAGAVKKFREQRIFETQNQFGAAPSFLAPESIAQLDVFFGRNAPSGTTDRFGGGISGRTSGGGGGATSTKASRDKALREQKEFIEALRSLQLEQIRQAEEIAKAGRDNQLGILQDQYAQSLIGTNDFYTQKLAIQERNIQAELNLLQVEASQLEQSRSAEKGAKKIKIEEKLTQVYAEQQIKVLALTALLQQNFEEYKKVIGKLDPNLDLSKQEQVQGEFVTEAQRRARATLAAAAQAQSQYQLENIALAEREANIQNDVVRGVLTETEGRQEILRVQREYRDVLIQLSQIELSGESDPLKAAQLSLRIEQLRSLGIELNSTQRFLKGLGSDTETLGDIFERFGQNVASSFNNIKDVFNGLKTAVKQFFADILGNSLKNLLRGTLGALFGGGAVSGGGGGGGFLGGLGGALGGIFRTPGINPSAGGGGGLLGGLLGGFGSSGGGFATGGFAGGGGAASILGGLPILPNILLGTGRPLPTAGGGFGGILGGVVGGLGNLFKGFGFGLPAGSATGSLAASAPLLGIGLGASLGGSSILGQLLGGVGGGLLGIGLTAAPAGLLGGALGFLAPLFSNPVTAIIGAAILPLAIFAGRAKQRRADEEQSGIWLTEAIAGIQQIKAGVQSGSIPGDQARSLFENNVLSTFIQQINTLKTRSVRESRLTNQVRDLRNLFDKEVGPVIEASRKAATVNRNIIPEFHVGGLAGNETLAVLQRGEMVLTAAHQNRINSMMPGVFESVGVPNAPNQTGTYHGGGKVGLGIGQGVAIDVTIVVGKQDQTEMFINGIQTETGKKALARSILRGRLDREI